MWLSWSISPSDIGFPVYATRINMLDILMGFGSSQYKHVDMRHIHRKSKVRNSTGENGASPLLYSHVKSLMRIAFCVLWRNWGEALPDFHHKNKEKCCRIFIVEIWQQFQTQLESINRDHTHLESKPQSPTHLMLRKLMPIAYFQLLMSLNYDFTKIMNCL